MAFDITERRGQLESLQEYITSVDSQLSLIGRELNWGTSCAAADEEEVELVECPETAEHQVPKERLAAHVEQCRWRRAGYLDDDVPLPMCPPHAGEHERCIQIGQEEQTAVFREALLHNPALNIKFVGQCDDRPPPETSSRLMADFTTDERRVLYDYAVSKTRRETSVKLEDLTMSFQKEEKPKSKSVLEKMAEERDAKRRRISYRTLKVHTNRKSQTEILREVILNQMEVLKEWRTQMSNTNVESNMEKHYEAMHESSELKCSGEEDSGIGNHSRYEEFGAGTSESSRQSVVSSYRGESPWRMIEREGRNPYIRENWEIIYEKHARRTHSYEASPSDSHHRDGKNIKHDKYTDKHNVASFEKYKNREKMNRHSDHGYDRKREDSRVKAKHEKKYYQSAHDYEREVEFSELNSKHHSNSDSRRESFKSGGNKHHRRYYDNDDSSGSERSATKPHQQHSSKSDRMLSVVSEGHTQYSERISITQSECSDDSHSYKHRRGSDVYEGGAQHSYSRSRKNRRSKERNRDHSRRSSSGNSRASSRSKHKKRKKKKKNYKGHKVSSNSDSCS